MPSSLRGGAVMRKVLLGTAALIALVAPAISGDMRAPLYKARKGNPGSHGQPRLHMICVDGGSGLLAALPSVLHGIPVQRCWAHKFRNVLDKVRKADQPQGQTSSAQDHECRHPAQAADGGDALSSEGPQGNLDRPTMGRCRCFSGPGAVAWSKYPGRAGGFSFGAARSGLPVSLQLDCPPPLRNALSFVSPNFQPCARGASGDGGVSLNSRGSQSTIRPSRSYGGRSPDADGGGR
jgi:hypothetical protein